MALLDKSDFRRRRWFKVTYKWSQP